MDNKLNPQNDPNRQSVDGPRHAETTNHGPSSLFPQSALGGGTSFWSESVVVMPDQPLASSQAVMNWGQIPQKSLIDDATQTTSGFNSHTQWSTQSVFDDGNRPQTSDSEVIAKLLDCLPLWNTRNRKRSSKLRTKFMGILQDYPDVNLNKLVNGKALLHAVCRQSKVDVLDLLLQSPHINVNIRDGHKSQTPLHVAVTQGTLSSVEQLLNVAEIDVQAEDADGYIAVHYAANSAMPTADTWSLEKEIKDYSRVFLQLCRDGAVNAKTPERRGPLHLAAEAGNIPALNVLLAQPDLDINMKDVHGDTALHLAKNDEVIDLLLDKALDANVQNIDGNTALHCELARRLMVLTQPLFTHTRLDADMPNKKGEQLMHIAAAQRSIDVFNHLAATPPSGNINMQTESGETVLHIAIQAENTDFVKHLLTLPNIDVNVRDERLQTPLHLACEKGNINIVNDLLTFPRIDVNIKDQRLQTPLHLACGKGHTEIVKDLRSVSSIDVNAQDEKSRTPLHLACEEGHIDSVRILLDHAHILAQARATDCRHIASGLASGTQIVCDSLPITLDIDQRVPDSGATALHFAAHGGHLETVFILLEHGANPQLTCRSFVNPSNAVEPDAAGVATKIEVIDLIRRYRWRSISLNPDPPSPAQEALLETHASGVYVVWEWPRAEHSLNEHSRNPRRRRQRIFPDVSSIKRMKGYDGRYKRVFEKERETKWVHFSAQNDFCRLMYSYDSLRSEGMDVLTFIDDTFDQGSTSGISNEDLYREHCVNVSNLSVVTGQETIEDSSTPRKSSITYSGGEAGHEVQHYSVADIVIPLIDIDMMSPGFVSNDISYVHNNNGRPSVLTMDPYESQGLNVKEQRHVEMMKSFHSAFNAQRARTLDHYFHRDLADTDLQMVNAEQVVSRFIHYEQAKREPCSRQHNICNDKLRLKPRSRGYSLTKVLKKPMGTTAADLENAWVDEGREKSNIRSEPSRQFVLVVPQIWLWKIDNVLITAFPAKWDSSNMHSAPEYIRSRVEMQKEDVSSDKLLHEILVACLEYQPTFSLFGRQLTYQDAFSGEISRIVSLYWSTTIPSYSHCAKKNPMQSRDIDYCYKSFRNDLGKSDDRFLDSFRTATTSLLDIDDVLNELTMIKRVYQNQAQVWEDMHKDQTLAMECSCRPDHAPRRLYTVMTRLEEDAQRVRESVVTLLQLTQGSASTENALKASEQSKILAIFTVVTVIFTPLSWIAALFALKIESFHAEEAWTSGQVAGGSIICLVGTLILCALGWKWLNRDRAAGEQGDGLRSERRTCSS
ncbi:hypothetical protein J7T55_003813 [Diaporthe amygdali]|uniref:uncharacterized protein n=1 Tax=Phomopsis amygdali TaxID=1214568 RepID=UPI0022FED347|nr:uncharacterized protein J7T55_003813 [Diaporthe amygdali]KAJ0117399.1 hypothetical protein J7T55_003813 [Diaporthe amygdali]